MKRLKPAVHGLATLLALMLAAVPASADPASAGVEGAWSRAMPPVARTGAAYLTVHNPGTEALHLVGADSPVAERIELHTHVMRDGMMRMTRLPEVVIQAGASVRFEPHGLHLMMFGLREPLEAGKVFAMTLHFAGGKRQSVQVEVRREAPADGQRMHQGHGKHGMQHGKP